MMIQEMDGKLYFIRDFKNSQNFVIFDNFCLTDHSPQDVKLNCFSSKFWELPDHCALPWKELFYDEIETKTGENLARNLKKIQILRIFSLKPNNCCLNSSNYLPETFYR